MRSNVGLERSVLHSSVGFWSSVAYTVCLVALNISFIVMAVRLPAMDWEGIESYSQTFQSISFLPQVFGLASIPAFILMLASIHKSFHYSRNIWSLAGLAFGTAFATLLGSLYFLQVAIVLPSLRNGTWGGLDQFVFANPQSLAWGLNHFAWSLLGFSLLSIAWVFEGDNLNRWIRLLCTLNGLANISLIFSYSFRVETLTLVIAIMSWVIALPLLSVLLALWFKRNLRSVGNGNSFLENIY
ncbi:MAG: hypothetical protein PVF85_05405 [Anaerolineales bacterium]|jgi:hypothetical protein